MPNPKQIFEPSNDLEHALLQAQEGRLAVSALMKTLLASKVFVLIDKELGPSGVWDNSVSPMVLSNVAGGPVLAVFTAPERSAEWPKNYPQYKFGLLTDFRWLLKGIATGVGVAINPGSPVSLEMPAAGVEQLKTEANAI